MSFKEHLKQLLENKKLLALLAVGLAIHYIVMRNKHSEKNVNLDKRIEFNLSHQTEIETAISNEIQKRIAMLKTQADGDSSSKLSYNDWVIFNNKSPFVYINADQNMGYFIQVWRNIPDTNNDKFILQVYPDKNLLFHTWEEVLEDITSKRVSIQDEPENDLIKLFFQSAMKPYSVFQYGWYDPIFNIVAERREIVYTYDDGLGNKGTISAGYTLRNLEEEYTYDHYKKPELKILYYGSILLTILLTIIIYYFNIKRPEIAFMKSSIFYVIFMTYITYYMTIEDEEGSVDIEMKKLENINQGVLSMSFMTGLSIFILDKLKENSTLLYKESKFLLVIYMLAIVAVLFKNNSYINTEDITTQRVYKEYIFNYCILINTFIIINFGIDTLYS